MTNMNVKLIKGENNQTIIFNEKLKIYIILTEQTLMKEECGRGVYFETNLNEVQ